MKKIETMTEYDRIKMARLQKELPLNKESWKHDLETYKLILNEGGIPYSLINAAAIHNTLIVFECQLAEERRKSGLWTPRNKEMEVNALGMVMARSVNLKLEGGIPVNCGDIIMYNRAFLVKEIEYSDFKMDIIQPSALLMKVPPDIMDQFIVTADPLAVFKPKKIDISTVEGQMAVKDISMPTGMTQGDQEYQRPLGRDLTDEEKEKLQDYGKRL